MPAEDMTSLRFGRLTVMHRLPNGPTRHARWRCHCTCGNETDVYGIDLRSTRTVSCGCYNREEGHAKLRRAQASLHKHGHAAPRSPEYLAWVRLRKRGRSHGIPICPRWTAFDAFLADLGPRPSAKHCLRCADDRRGYEPGNVAWVAARATNGA